MAAASFSPITYQERAFKSIYVAVCFLLAAFSAAAMETSPSSASPLVGISVDFIGDGKTLGTGSFVVTPGHTKAMRVNISPTDSMWFIVTPSVREGGRIEVEFAARKSMLDRVSDDSIKTVVRLHSGGEVFLPFGPVLQSAPSKAMPWERTRYRLKVSASSL